MISQFIALIAVLAVAAAYPSKQTQEYEYQQQTQKQIPIVKYESEQNKDSYSYGYESGNGIVAAESGVLKNAGQKDAAIVSQGFYSYVGADGKTYAVKYVADENGFRAVGDHLPTPPPIPAEIQEALAKIASQPHQQYQEEQQQWNDNGKDNDDKAYYYVQQQPSEQNQKW